VTPVVAAFLLGIGAGIGLVLAVTNFQSLWRGWRRSSGLSAAEIDRWLKARPDDE
jgi:hypothetical protein